MRICEYVASAAEAVKRNAPDASPVKNACINSFTKIAEPVKSVCRNSYDCGSAAFAKIDHTVWTARLRRRPAGGAYEMIPAEEVEERDGLIAAPMKTNPGGETTGAYKKIPAEEVEEGERLIAAPVKTNPCSYGGAAKSVSYSYGFLTFAKLGYTVRVKVVYRIVQWISADGTKSSVTIYSTNFAHESDNGDKLILETDDLDTAKNESKNSFAKMAESIKEWMSSPTIRSRIIVYAAILAENVRVYGLQHGSILCGDVFSMILSKTLVDIVYDLVIEKADSRNHEFLPGVEMDDKWYSFVFKFLKEKFGICALRECLEFMVIEFIAFLRMEALRPQSFGKGVFTVKYLMSMMRRFFEFVKKRHCGAGFFIIQAILMAAMRKRRCADQSKNEWGFHGSATKRKKNRKK